MGADFLESLQIFTEFAVDAVGEDLGVFPVDDIALAIEEPGRDFVLRGVLDDGYNAFKFFRGKFTGAAGVVSWGRVFLCLDDWGRIVSHGGALVD
jgi:hypothetical protein